MASPRRRRRIASVAALSAVLLVASGQAALAAAQHGWKDSAGCNFSGSGSHFRLDVRTTANDSWSTVKLPGGKNSAGNWNNTARLKTTNCNGNPTSEKVSMTWTITAEGWGINCGVGFPASVSCSGSGSAKTLTIHQTEVWTGSDGIAQFTIGSGETWTFDDGTFGDTEKVCGKVHVRSYAGSGLGMDAYACVDAD